MLYRLLKLYARFALKIYCPYLYVNKASILKAKGPLLLVANHPNSFLDGIILTTLFDQPVYSLARGDVFKQKWINNLLRSLQLLPIYRTSEGVENLEYNYTTFASCIEVFQKGGIVLIFSEGLCENEWHLRPLRKGTARLALIAWQKGIPLQVLPTAFNYSSFKQFGKIVHLLFGTPFSKEVIKGSPSHGKQLLAFNKQLQQQLQHLVYEIEDGDKQKVEAIFKPASPPLQKVILVVPALIGFLLHTALFYPLKAITHLGFAQSGHYDGVLTALMMLLYPFYVLALIIVLFHWVGWWSLLLLLISPLTAWAFMKLKFLF